MGEQLQPGARVWCLDASGEWLPCIATTGIVDGRDFPVVWAHKESLGPEHAIPWPAEDVKTRSSRKAGGAAA